MNAAIQETEQTGVTPWSVDTFIAGYLDQRDISPGSRSTYRRALKQFFNWLDSEGISPAQLTGAAMIRYKGKLQDEGKSPFSVNLYVTSVRQLYAHLVGLGAMKDNPCAAVKAAKLPKGHMKDSLSGEQLRTVLDSIPTDSPTYLRDSAIIGLMARTGMRSVEIARAKVGDLQNKNGRLVLWLQGKGRQAKDDYVILTESVHEPLLRYIETRKGMQTSDWLFENTVLLGEGLSTRTIQGICKAAFRRAGLVSPRISSHSLRHSFASISINSGCDIRAVSRAMRHASLAQTLVYTHENDREQGQVAEDFVSF